MLLLNNQINWLINFDGIIYKNQNEEKELLSQFIQKESELGKEVLIDETHIVL